MEIAPNAPKAQIDEVFSILEKAGWPKDKIKVKRGQTIHESHADSAKRS
jgi:hypothetical protein